MSAPHMLSTLQLGFIVAGARGTLTGSERYYWDLLRTLPAQCVRVQGLVVGDPGAIDEPVADVASVAPEGGGPVARIRSLRRAVREGVRTSDVVVSHHAQQTLPVLDVIRSRPLVEHVHGPLVREGRAEGVGPKSLAMRALAENVVYRRAQRLVVLSEANAAILREDYRIASDRIRIVPGAVDLRRFRRTGTRADARRALRWPLDRPIVVAVRRLAPTKGLEELVDAIDLVRRDVHDVLVMLVGAGPRAEDLRRLVADRGLTRWIRFAGQVRDELPLVYRAADLSVTPSVALEGFGLVVAESLACGTPALVTPVAGLPEVVRDLDPALIVGGTDPARLAAGIRAALTGAVALPDEERCVAYAQRFDWTTIAARIGDIYREVA